MSGWRSQIGRRRRLDALSGNHGVFAVAAIDHRDALTAAHAKAGLEKPSREQVLQFRIPGLGVLWNDALHCAPIHPYWVAKARAEAGVVTSNFGTECFRIPLERISHHPAAYFRNATFWEAVTTRFTCPPAPGGRTWRSGATASCGPSRTR